MTRVEHGNSVFSNLSQIRDARTFGQEQFINKSDINNRTGTKVLQATQRRLDRQRRGTPLGRLAGMGSLLGGIRDNDPVMSMFPTRFARPDYEDGFGDEPDYNVSLIVNRQVKKAAPSCDDIQENTLAILFKDNENNLNTACIEIFSIQLNALDIITPSVFNYAIGLLQQRKALRFPEEYKKDTPSDYWKDYSFDGAPEHVQPWQNRSSAFTVGGTLVDNNCVDTTDSCTSLVTMAARAVIKLTNYWGSNVKPGAHLFAVIRKFEPSDYSYDYMIGNTLMTNQSAKKLAASSNDCGVNPFRPYQMAFLCLPNGGPVPPQYTEYYDEQGLLRTDGLAIKIGVVTEVPMGHVFRENVGRLKPFTGAIPLCPLSHYTMTNDYRPMSSYPITIILRSDDGIMPI